MSPSGPAASVAAENLSDAERQMVRAAISGTLVDLRTGHASDDDPAHGKSWDISRQIRATLLADLLTSVRCTSGEPPLAVKLRGARITGSLDLEAATLTCPLLLQDCYIHELVNLDDATARVIRLPGSHLPGLTARQLHTTGDLDLSATSFAPDSDLRLGGAHIGGRLNLDGATLANPGGIAMNGDGLAVEGSMLCGRGFAAAGEFRLEGAHIAGFLDMDGATLTNPGGMALNAIQITVGNSMYCGERFTATGEVRLIGGHIGGQFNLLGGGALTNLGSTALCADGLVIDQDMMWSDRFTVTGVIRLSGARIGGQLDLSDASLTGAGGGLALLANGLTVGRDMFCLDGFIADGEVRLDDAHVGGDLNLTGATLTNPDRRALFAQRITVGGSILCGDGFTATGEIYLGGAQIGGALSLNRATLTNGDGTALNAIAISVGASMLCEGFTATGAIGLDGAHIGGELRFDGATLTNPDRRALSASRLTVDHNVTCQNGFSATGEICLYEARVNGELIMYGATLTNPDGMALNAVGLTVDQAMFCGRGFAATGEISMSRAQISQLFVTEASLTNPSGSVLNLERAVINTLVLLPSGRPDGRIDLSGAKVEVFTDAQNSWPEVLILRSFVYGTLANHEINTRARLQWLKRNPGRFVPQLYDQLAETYRRAGDESAARKVAVAKQWHRRHALNPLNWLWYLTVGYGYRTWLAVIWLAALVGLGTWIFSAAYPAHMIAISAHPPAFHAAAYALDLLLPVVGLGQKSAWQPQGSALLYWSWAMTAAGWVLTTAVVAGLTGILKRS
jgi:hypothetical protein